MLDIFFNPDATVLGNAKCRLCLSNGSPRKGFEGFSNFYFCMKGSLACCSAVASSIKVEHSWPAVPRPALPVCLGSPALAAGTAHEGTEKLLFCRDAVGFPTLQRSCVISPPASGSLLEGEDREIFLHLFPFQSRTENIKGLRLVEFCQCPGKHLDSSDLPAAFKGVP